MYSQVWQTDFKPKLGELKDRFPNSHVVSGDCELAYFTALSFFPEFKCLFGGGALEAKMTDFGFS